MMVIDGGYGKVEEKDVFMMEGGELQDEEEKNRKSWFEYEIIVFSEYLLYCDLYEFFFFYNNFNRFYLI